MSKYWVGDYEYGGMDEDEALYYMAEKGRTSEIPWGAAVKLYFNFPELRDNLEWEYPELRDEYDYYERTGEPPYELRDEYDYDYCGFYNRYEWR